MERLAQSEYEKLIEEYIALVKMHFSSVARGNELQIVNHRWWFTRGGRTEDKRNKLYTSEVENWRRI